MPNQLGAPTQLTCFELTRPVASANTVFTYATSGKNTASPRQSGPSVPTLTPALSEATRYRKKNVTNQLEQNKSHRRPPQGGYPPPCTLHAPPCTLSSMRPSHPTRAEFLRLARAHSLVPLYRTLTADLETPVSAFLRVAAAEPECFLLESVEGGEHLGRYTYIGIRPSRRIVAHGAEIEITEHGKTRRVSGDVFALLRDALNGHTPARIPGLPPFTAGAVGFFSYDVVRQIERLPSHTTDDLGLPDACLMFFDEVLAFDHVKKEILLIATADLRRHKPQAAYADALRRLDRLEKRLAQSLPKLASKKPAGKLRLTPRTKKPAFLKSVERAKEYIAAGDIFQVVLSQRLDLEPGVDPFSVYRALRIVNPSPYMYFLRFDRRKTGPKSAKSKAEKEETTHIVGSSPELLVRVEGRRIEYRPIAGTRPRAASEAADLAAEQEMLHDEKERAEHVMLVDLGRNDVGRVSEYGTVNVTNLMHVERYSHVMHLVSDVEGRLRPELSAVDALRSCFPAGTLSGAPKIRAMEIIEQLESTRRGIYGGTVLYADYSGNLTSCIAIRTLLVEGRKGFIQAGAGIVADSIPENEYQESLNKAKAVVRAVERARGD
jgi:anthranilate synthase component 1